MKKLLSLVAAIIIAATTFAKEDEVTLTVIGTGVNEEQATLQALRSAIEQSFGTFVSSNTTILNDKLVQDEIVSVSTGNVKKYDKLAVATLPNNQVSVSLKATVSINNLISYAKSKGSRAEFAGQTFAMNIKLAELKKYSAEKAYNIMKRQLKRFAKDLFDFKLEIVGEPCIAYLKTPCPFGNCSDEYYAITCNVSVLSNVMSTNYYNLITNTLKELALSNDEIAFFKKEGIYTTESRFFGNTYPFVMSDKEIISDIEDALFRYKITAIEASQNSYSFEWPEPEKGGITQAKGSDRHSPLLPKGDGLTCICRDRNEGIGFRLHSSLLQANIPYCYAPLPWGGTHKSFPQRRELTDEDLKNMTSAKCRAWLSNFAMDETKTPLKLTKEQKKAAKNGTYTGPKYTITYSNPNVVSRHKLILYVPKAEMKSFKGFEIKL